jgi:putative PIN family toxin of toxin-antitoxin system
VRILLDTNILVRAAISPDGLARKILDRIRDNDEHVLVVSSHILSEVADVLSRPRMRARWPLSDDEIQRYCQFLSAASEEVSIRPVAQVIDDPKDQAVIEAAVAARVDAICTGDVHFETQAVREFLAGFGIAVLTDRDLLALLA